MALFDTTWYASSVGWSAVTAWATGTAKAAGALIRQSAPTVGNERVFICIIAGTTHATTEPTWTITRGARTTDNTVTWQECSGASAVNGDLTNTPNWTSVKNTAITLGVIIKRDNLASYQICSVAGTAGNAAEPSFSDTAGTTTADNTVTWTSLGVVGNFTGGQAPHARLQNALATTWASAGNTIFVKSDHAQTQGSQLDLNGVGTVANPNKIVCHNGAAYPPLSANLTTGAVCTTTGAFTIQFLSSSGAGLYIRGIAFECGTGANSLNLAMIASASPAVLVFENCALRMVATGTTGRINCCHSGVAGLVKCLNTTVKFAATGQALGTLAGGGLLHWKGGSLEAGSSIPAALFLGPGAAGNRLRALVEGCDLSAVTSGNSLVSNSLATGSLDITFKDCKLASGVTISGAPAGPVTSVDLIRCDSGVVNYRSERYRYQGTETTETTIVRTGGASDGTTAQARKIITTSTSLFIDPFEMTPIVVWNETTGSAITLTVCGIWGGGAVPNNDNIWMDVEYFGSGSTPQGSFLSGTKADILASGSALASDSSTWGGSTTKFKFTATITPQMKGPIFCYVKAALASTTFYIDPKVTIT